MWAMFYVVWEQAPPSWLLWLETDLAKEKQSGEIALSTGLRQGERGV